MHDAREFAGNTHYEMIRTKDKSLRTLRTEMDKTKIPDNRFK